MKKLTVLIASVFSLTFMATSCSQYGCPGHISYENQFDKDLKSYDILALSLENLDCSN